MPQRVKKSRNFEIKKEATDMATVCNKFKSLLYG